MTNSKKLAPWRSWALVLNYFLGYVVLYPRLARKITLILDPTASSILPIIEWSIYIGMIVISIALAWPLLVEKCPIKRKKFFENIVLLVVGVYVISLAASSIIMLVTGATTSNNEMMIQEQMRTNPILISFTAVIYAPIVEELVFRGAIYRSLEPKFGFILSGLIAGISFGMIHVLESLALGNYADLLYLLQYGGIGILFCYAYKVNRSIYSPILLHFINNLVVTILSLILIYLK